MAYTNEEIFLTSMLKTVLLFLTNQATGYISHGIGSSFSGNLLLLPLLRHDVKILVKSRGGGTVLCLASAVNVQQK